MQKFLWAIIGVVIAVGSYFGYINYERYKFKEAVSHHVKNASLRLANAIRYETEQGTKITYKELFEKLESDVAEIDKRVIGIQTIATPDDEEITNPILAYLKSGQELLRALQQKYRKLLAFSSSIEWATRSMEELRSASYYGFDYANRAANRALKEAEKAEAEYNEAVNDLIDAARTVIECHKRIVGLVRDDALIDVKIFEEVVRKNEEEAKNEKEAKNKSGKNLSNPS